MSVLEQSVYVTGLSDTNVTSHNLATHFGSVGAIKHVFIVFDEASSKPSGEAYVVFTEAEQANQAVDEKNGENFKGKQLAVAIVTEDKENELADFIQEAKYREIQELQARMSSLDASDLQQILKGFEQKPAHVTHEKSESFPASPTHPTDRRRVPDPSMPNQSLHLDSSQVVPVSMLRADHGIRIPQFSGDGNKGELSYMQWKYEVNCLARERVDSSALLHAIRRSLRGTAAEIMRCISDPLTVERVLSRLDITYGNVLSTEQLFQEFYSARQKPDESINDWACRLEALLTQLKEQGSLESSSARDMLCSKFWSGLSSSEVRMASRYKFDARVGFEELFKYVRSLDFEVRTENKSKKPVVKQMTQEQTLLKRMDELCTKFTGCEKGLTEIKDRVTALESQVNSSQVPVNQVQREAKPKPKYRKKLAVLCTRCGRRGHAEKKCYAKIHIDGSHLNLRAPSTQDGE